MGVELADLGRGELKELLGIWKQARRGRPVPALGSVCPVDVAPYLSQIVIVEIEERTDRIRLVQVGRELAPILGDDVEGRYLDTLPKSLRSHVEESYRVMLAERAPQYAEFEVSGDSWFVILERLMMPFCNEYTGRVAGAMVAIYPRISITKRPPAVDARDAIVAA